MAGSQKCGQRVTPIPFLSNWGIYGHMESVHTKRRVYGPEGRRRLEGQVFGNLTALSYWGHDRSKAGYTFWRCRCSCGEQVIVATRRLVQGRKKSCGKNGHRWKRAGEGKTRTPEYVSWRKMWERCDDTKHKRYADYGGRGIKVCTRWESFDLFLQDMGPKPTPKHTIEREDNDKGYLPGNCRWATRDEQRRNMRSSVYVEWEGERLLLMDLCARLGVERGTVYGRLKNGWALEEALTTPKRSPSSKIKERTL